MTRYRCHDCSITVFAMGTPTEDENECDDCGEPMVKL